jgi:hypothetical protein
MFGANRDKEIREATEAAKAAVIAEHEKGAAYWEEQADFQEAMGDSEGANSLRDLVQFGREHVIDPIRKI